MSPTERYRFDVQGFLVRRGVLDRGEIEALNAAVDVLGVPPPGPDLSSQRFSGHLPVARRFRDLIDHPAVLEVVRETCGPNVRLDHTYGIVMSPGTSGLGLHGGATPFDPAQYYRVDGGRIHTGLVAAQWALVDHPAGGGGFMCVPGSHKAGFPLPSPFDPDLVAEVPLAAGDVVLFTEALTHGTLPWQGPHERRTLLYKYSPGNSAWGHVDWPAGLLELCTPRQQLLLQPPSVGRHRPVVP
jgi:ectoine hydroxylase-related dioxygenase (phytanoyl-CoA dioxygenase family)